MPNKKYPGAVIRNLAGKRLNNSDRELPSPKQNNQRILKPTRASMVGGTGNSLQMAARKRLANGSSRR